MNDSERMIREFIVRELMFSDDLSSLASDTPLLETGAIDSMDLQRLVAFLETGFGVTVPDQELIGQNFETVEAIATLVGKLKGRD